MPKHCQKHSSSNSNRTTTSVQDHSRNNLHPSGLSMANQNSTKHQQHTRSDRRRNKMHHRDRWLGATDLDTIKHAIHSSGALKSSRYWIKNRTMAGMREKLRHATHQYRILSWLDANDVIHPLRSLHSILLLLNHHCERVNTAYARVSLKNKKIITRNGKFSH